PTMPSASMARGGVQGRSGTEAVAATAASSREQRLLLFIPKEGEPITAPTCCPEGLQYKAICIHAGYLPWEEVAIYQSKGAQVSADPPPLDGEM
ncbi:hypothetical protein E2562_016105, partial [Oryza meyeriana var. granulata]